MIFLILGYGVPKDMSKDDNYNTYLKTALNKIYDLAIVNQAERPTIILSGGHTDMYKPFKRTEAGEMLKFIKNHISKSTLKNIAKHWQFITEAKSISSLENLINTKEILESKRITDKTLYIFCEQTREKRIKKLAGKIFGKIFKISIIPIDFDISSNRYIDPKLITKKEKVELKNALWALESQENFKKLHQLYLDRLVFLRSAGPGIHDLAVKKWWEERLRSLD